MGISVYSMRERTKEDLRVDLTSERERSNESKQASEAYQNDSLGY